MEKAIGLSAQTFAATLRERTIRSLVCETHCSRGLLTADAAVNSPPLQQRGPVILWDDTFVRYHEPHIGIAAVKVLEALGFEVSLAKNRRCCGRPAFSQGNLDAAAKVGKHNVDLLSSLHNASPARTSSTPILFLEPSCWSMFVEDYRELRIENAEKIANRCFLFEKFVDDLLDAGTGYALHFKHSTASRARNGVDDRNSSALPRQIDHESCVHANDSRNVCPGRKQPCSIQHAAEWQARSARSPRNTISPSKSPRI